MSRTRARVTQADVVCYITARLVLDLQPRPGFTHVECVDMWASAVRTTIERNAALHNAVVS